MIVVFVVSGARHRAPARFWSPTTGGKQFNWCAVMTRCLSLTNCTRFGNLREGCIIVRNVMNGSRKDLRIPPSSCPIIPLSKRVCIRCLGKLPAWFVRQVCDPCIDWEIAYLREANAR